MFSRKEMYQEPDVVAKIMTQLSLKVRLQTWGTEAKKAAHSEIEASPLETLSSNCTGEIELQTKGKLF